MKPGSEQLDRAQHVLLHVACSVLLSLAVYSCIEKFTSLPTSTTNEVMKVELGLGRKGKILSMSR